LAAEGGWVWKFDSLGMRTESPPPPIEAVGAFLERDVCLDPGLGDWLLETIDDIVSGRELAAQQVSAAPPRQSYVILDDTHPEEIVTLIAEVCCDFSECGERYRDTLKDRCGTFLRCEVDALEFRAALVNWLAFIRNETKDARRRAALLDWLAFIRDETRG
jgi:hypothetical protein